MIAQDLINECTTKESSSEWILENFYPDYFKQKQADKNITKCLKELK